MATTLAARMPLENFGQGESLKTPWWAWPIPLFVALMLQMASNLINDYYDAQSGVDTNRKFGPPRVVSMGLIPAAQVKLLFVILLMTAFILGTFLSMAYSGLGLFLLGITCILFAYLYTGGPWPLSHLGLGEIVAFIFFGPVAVSGTFYALTLSPEFMLNPHVLNAGIIAGLFASTIMATNNLRDIKSDASTGKKTLLVLTEKYFGYKIARTIPSTCLFLAWIFGLQDLLFFYKQSAWLSLSFIVLAQLLPLIFFKVTSGITLNELPNSRFNSALAKTGQWLFIYALLKSLAWWIW